MLSVTDQQIEAWFKARQIAPQAQLDETLVLRAARRVNEQLLAAQEHGR